MKISMIGAGRVGATAAFSVLTQGLCDSFAFVDVLGDLARGEALDLLHGVSLLPRQVKMAGGDDYVLSKDSDVVIITAGIPRQPGETRLDLLKKNVGLMKDVVAKVVAQSPNAVLIMVSNPVDALTYLAARESKFPTSRVVGTGTLLDSVRFRSFLGDRLGLVSSQVQAYMIGEHGDSMVPVLSQLRVDGIPLTSFPGFAGKINEILERTKNGGAEVIALKKGTMYPVGLMIARIARAIVFDSGEILPVSTVIDDYYGIRNVALSVPTRIGRGGALERIKLELSDDELEKLRKSAQVLRSALDSVGY
ncbi:MAG: L-lactate dehydrogenase [Deinococcus sp.]|nr:L-lactate dehydrogenase [Deinococcus sp.]